MLEITTEILANYTGLNEARQKLIIVSGWTDSYHFSLVCV